LKHWSVPGLIITGIVGSFTNTILVLAMIGVLGYVPWIALGPIAIANGLPEAGAAALLTLVIVAAWQQIEVGHRRGANL
jgi:hypothetical protein